MQKIKILDLVLPILLTISLFYTYKFNWWSNGNLKIQDYILFPTLLTFFLIFKNRIYEILIILLCGLVININGFGPIGSCLILFFCCFNIGFAFINKILDYKTNLLSYESLCVGLAIISSVIFILSFFKISYPITYFILFFIPSIIIFKKFDIISNFKKIELTLPQKPSFFAILIFSYLVVYYFSAVLLPEVSHDAVSHHLTIATRMGVNHFWPYDVNQYIWSVTPQGTQWIFTFLYFFGGITSVKLFLLLIIFSMSLFIYNFSLKKFGDSNFSALAALMILSLPINLYLLRGQFIDLFHALIISCLFIIFLENKKNKWILIAAITGFGFAIKSSTIIIIPGLIFLYFFEILNEKKINIKQFLFSCLTLLLFGVGPYILSFIKTGSPTFPLYNEIFKSDLISKEAFYHPFYAQSDVFDFFKSSILSKKYGEYGNNGAIGIGIIVLSPIILFLKLKYFKRLEIYVFLTLILACAIMFKFQAYIRYIYFLIPSLLLIIQLITYERVNNKKIFKIILCFLIFINCLRFDKITNELPNNLELYFSKNKIINYEITNKPLAKIADIINSEEQFKKKKILVLSYNNDPLYYKFDLPVMFFSWHSPSFFQNIIKFASLEKTVKEIGITHIIYNSDHTTEKYERFFKDHPNSFSTEIFKLYGFTVAKTNLENAIN